MFYLINIFKSSINSFQHSFYLWYLIFIFIVMPLDILYQIDSLILALRPIDIISDILVVTFLFTILITIIASINYIFSFFFHIISPKYANNIIISVNNFTGITISLYIIFKTAQLWISQVYNNIYFQFFSLGTDNSLYHVWLILRVGLLLTWIIFYVLMLKRINQCVTDYIKTKHRLIQIFIAISAFIVLSKSIFPIYFNQNNLKRYNAAQKDRSNIILITFDALRAKDMSLYGYHLKTTPYIDEFAKESYVFNNAISNANWTRPAITSILTGVYPFTHKNYSFFLNLEEKFKYNNLPNILSENGYETIAIVSKIIKYSHPKANNLSLGFNQSPLDIIDKSFIDSQNRLQFLKPFFLPYLSRPYFYFDESLNKFYDFLKRYDFLKIFFHDYLKVKKLENEIEAPPDITFKSAIDSLKTLKVKPSPFFIWIHIFPPHFPYIAKKPFKYSLLKEHELDTLSAQKKVAENRFYNKDFQTVVDKMRLRYDEHILYADHSAGKFLEYLKKEGYFENSIIILTADHGESFEHGYMGHMGHFLYNDLINIPLIIHLPCQKAGKKFFTCVEQIDLAPTILDYIGISTPEWMEGESLKRYVTSDINSIKPKFSMQLLGNNINKNGLTQGTIAIVKDNYKYIYSLKDDSGELYNIVKDKKEIFELSKIERNKAQEFKESIIKEFMVQRNHRN